MVFITVFVCLFYATCRSVHSYAQYPITPARDFQFDNLDRGVPSEDYEIIEREGYSLGYDESVEQARWVSYRLTVHEVTNKVISRTNNFRSDPMVSTGSASVEDYRRSGYDRGHLAPAGDMAFSAMVMSDSFYMSNMSPQKPAFNRGVWKRLEEFVRNVAVAEESIVVVTGGVFVDDETPVFIGGNKVRVPEFFYKVIFDETPPLKAIGFILPNDGSKKSLEKFAQSVDEVEEATGLDFFNALPLDEQKRLESKSNASDWVWRDSRRGGR